MEIVSMNRSVRVLALAAVALALFGALGCNKLKARDQLNKGVQAYKGQRFEEAINRFQNAVALDPTLVNARLYLATAYAQQYVPGAETPENTRNAEMAIEQFKKVLESDPANINSVKGIASLYFNMKKMDSAKEYDLKAAAIDPNDPETYYSIAVIDWSQAFKLRNEERAKLGLKMTDDIKDKKVCSDLLKKIEPNQAYVQDGIDNLNKALKLRPDYDDATAYLNLMYREQADLDCMNPGTRADDLKTADMWVEKTLAIKKQKADKTGSNGIVLDTSQPQK
jgi:tetratricopeptide (TPR) repeat protein